VVLVAPQGRRLDARRRLEVRAVVANIWPLRPRAVKAVTAIAPPGRQTRTISAAVSGWSAANIAPKTEVTR
jgi:hypothetical protein